MELDTEAQMVASILSKKKTAGATHTLIDIPVGPTAKVRTAAAAQRLASLFGAVADEIEIAVEVVVTDALGPVGFGIGPLLEARDVLAVLRREPGAPVDLREKSLFLASRVIELVGAAPPATGYAWRSKPWTPARRRRPSSRIVEAQGARELPPGAAHQVPLESPSDGRIRGIDCLEIARVAKRAGAPGNAAAGVRLLRTVGDVVSRGEPLFEIHAQSAVQLGFACAYARERVDLIRFGY